MLPKAGTHMHWNKCECKGTDFFAQKRIRVKKSNRSLHFLTLIKYVGLFQKPDGSSFLLFRPSEKAGTP